jgi:hypothetical protein
MRPSKRLTDFVSVKQIYKKIESQGFKFYCVGCNRERRQASPAKLGSLRFFAHIALTTAFLAVLTWPWLHVKGLFAFVIPVGLFFETFYRVKMRAALVCPDCEFDPLLYLSDRPEALRQVEGAWRAKFEEKNLPFPERRSRSRVSEKKPNSQNLTSI